VAASHIAGVCAEQSPGERGLSLLTSTQPAADLLAIPVIVVPEALPQRALLREDLDLCHEENHEERRHYEWAERPEPDGPAQEEHGQSHIRGIAGPTVDTIGVAMRCSLCAWARTATWGSEPLRQQVELLRQLSVAAAIPADSSCAGTP